MRTELELALDNGVAPWKLIDYRCKEFWVFRDAYPVTEGHLLFVPTAQTSECLHACFKAAYSWGYTGIQNEKWTGFNIGQNVGEAAGQTVPWPHIHLIPRRNGDIEDPTGGVRNVIPGKGNYRQNKIPKDIEKT